MKTGWILATLRLNFANAFANKKAFWTMMTLMSVQNLMFFLLWAILFTKIRSLGGWGLHEIGFLWGTSAIGYGLLFTAFGGINQLSQTVASGQLDVYMARPRSVLMSLLLTRLRPDSLGDFFSGVAVLVFVSPPSLEELPLLVALSLSAGLVMASARLFLHCLVFYGVDGETSENGFMTFLIAATNPQKGFGLWGKYILLSVFPAGYIGLLPVEILRHFSWELFALQIGGSLAFFAIALLFFSRGIKRYNSGNQYVVLR